MPGRSSQWIATDSSPNLRMTVSCTALHVDVFQAGRLTEDAADGVDLMDQGVQQDRWYSSRRNGVASPMARVMLAAVSARKFAIASSGIGETGASE